MFERDKYLERIADVDSTRIGHQGSKIMHVLKYISGDNPRTSISRKKENVTLWIYRRRDVWFKGTNYNYFNLYQKRIIINIDKC